MWWRVKERPGKELMISNVEVRLPRLTVEAICDECDRYDHDETGGRVIGTYQGSYRQGLTIDVAGILEPGPKARRTATSFFQDGDYQESVFRELERGDSTIEHLGSWHTHHVNGYPTLSGGDRETYHRYVNHQNHNIDFFYALLVTARSRNPRSAVDRYEMKHFILFRGVSQEFQIPPNKVHLVDRSPIWPRRSGQSATPTISVDSPNEAPSVQSNVRLDQSPDEQRANDSDFLKEFYPSIRPFAAKSSGLVYWRGEMELCDGSSAKVVLAEVSETGSRSYAATIKQEHINIEGLADRRFPSARAAAIWIERTANRMIFERRAS